MREKAHPKGRIPNNLSLRERDNGKETPDEERKEEIKKRKDCRTSDRIGKVRKWIG